jgi:hypothetical protein
MVVDILGKIVLVDGIKDVLKVVGTRLPKFDRKATIAAITAIQKATIKTRNFISDHGYKRNEDLTDLWHDALNKVIEAHIDEGLPDYLYQKARFWGEPSDWIANPKSLDLIPKLSQLDEKCGILLEKLKRK